MGSLAHVSHTLTATHAPLVPAAPTQSASLLHASGGALGSLGMLVREAQIPLRTVELDVLDDKTQKGDYLEISKILVPLIHLWKPDRLLIEDKAAGAPLMTSLKDLLSKGEIHYPVVIEPISPDAKGNKEDRMEAVSGVIEAGLVHLHEGCTWLEEFVEELALFPNGANDDRADALSQVLSHMMAKEVLLPSW